MTTRSNLDDCSFMRRLARGQLRRQWASGSILLKVGCSIDSQSCRARAPEILFRLSVAAFLKRKHLLRAIVAADSL